MCRQRKPDQCCIWNWAEIQGIEQQPECTDTHRSERREHDSILWQGSHHHDSGQPDFKRPEIYREGLCPYPCRMGDGKWRTIRPAFRGRYRLWHRKGSTCARLWTILSGKRRASGLGYRNRTGTGQELSYAAWRRHTGEKSARHRYHLLPAPESQQYLSTGVAWRGRTYRYTGSKGGEYRETGGSRFV